MRKYFKISVAVSLVLSILYMFSIRRPFPMASDGSGPNGDALLAYFIFLIACFMYVHTFILGLIVYGENKGETKAAFCVLIFGAFLLAYPEIKSSYTKQLSDYQYNSLPKTKASNTINSGTPAEFFKHFDAIPADEKTWTYLHDLKRDLIQAGRIDLLEQLELKGFALVQADGEEAWTSLVDAAIGTGKLAPELRLKTLELLFSKAAPFKFSLSKSQLDILSARNFEYIFDDVKNPTGRKIFDLLIENGASFRGKNPGYLLWYYARFKNLDHVKFLISQKADVNFVDENYQTSVLEEAIENKDEPMIQELLKFGAKKSSELQKQSATRRSA